MYCYCRQFCVCLSVQEMRGVRLLIILTDISSLRTSTLRGDCYARETEGQETFLALNNLIYELSVYIAGRLFYPLYFLE